MVSVKIPRGRASGLDARARPVSPPRVRRARDTGRSAHSTDPERDPYRLVDQERRRLARELHDETGQILTAAIFQVDLCLPALGDENPEVAGRLREIRQALLSATQDVRRLVYRLNPPLLDELGLVPALRAHIRRFEAQYGIPTTLDVAGDGPLRPDHEEALFRTIQECLTNVARHARATAVRVELALGPGAARCVVADDGRGFEPAAVAAIEPPRLGLAGMRDRIRQVGGTLRIISAPNRGTLVQISIPLEPAPARRAR